MAKYAVTVITFVLLFISQVSAYAADIVYIPIDNRPVSLSDPLAAMKAVGMNTIVPPDELLAGRGRYGDPERLWDWLESRAQTADALVLSADSLLYGGLVPSRIHHLPQAVLEKRAANFRKLRKANPNLQIYVFSTVMRTPRLSAGGMDPAYFEEYGEQIFRYSALQDKSEQQSLTKDEQSEMASLFTAIPEPAMLDWLTRRQINYNINSQLLTLTREKVFSYFVLGLDDNDRYSRTRQELRGLLQAEPELYGATFATFPGADQLGMILLTRAVNLLKGYRPFVAAIYAPGIGKDTIPSYQGESVFISVLNHVSATGAYLIFSPERADMVLAVNTPTNGVTLEAASPVNIRAKRPETVEFVATINKQLQSTPVAVADIAFGNGADNSLMAEMAAQDIPRRLAAYSGWNTASNSIGFAIAQGLLAKEMPQSDRQNMVGLRLLDDWAYQANVRQEVKRDFIAARGIDEVHLGSGRSLVEAETTVKLKQFAAERFGAFAVPEFEARHPWDRMFEVQIVLPGR
ncbi:hypothetical protein AXX12_07530 [Anaerosporomusa subterranea]|uniref:DUF4127 domain-containing protein n=1 Tax=Anaerosporomusa subterranea TaxID=1794912 RepID=A0A154BQQ7_ANASB|nr:DUF4127 family protein [Anaerosporomusa subterranea]KYZ76282.1 hypothetical protein AXX12_07530 [Anaerosporomusa subterranea]